MGVGMLGLGLRAAGLAATLLGLGLLPVGTLVCLRHCADSRGNYASLAMCEPKHKGPETYETTTTCGELVLKKTKYAKVALDTLSMRVYVNGSYTATVTDQRLKREKTGQMWGEESGVWPGATTALGASTLALVVGAGTVAALVVGEVDGGFLVFSLAVRALLLLIAALGALADAFQGTPTGRPLLFSGYEGFPLVLTWCVAGIFFLAGLGLAVVELFVPAREPTGTAQSTLSSMRPSEAPAAPPPTAPPPAYVCSQESLAAKGSNLQGSDTILPQAQQAGDPNAPAAQGQPQTPAQQTPGAPYPAQTQPPQTQPPPPPQSMAPTQQPMTQPQQMAQPQPMVQPQPLQQMAEPREAQAPVSPAAAAAVGSGAGAELAAAEAEALPPTDAEVRPKKKKSKKRKKGKKAPEVLSDDEPSDTETTTRPSHITPDPSSHTI